MPNIEKRKANPSSLAVWERKKRKWNSGLLKKKSISDNQMIESEAEENEQRSSSSTESMMSSRNNVQLPYDIIKEIILQLPAKYLLRFRLVSKYWFHYITDPRFVKMHLNFQAINKPPLLMMRISNVLPLFQVRLDDDEDGGDHIRQQLQQQEQQHQQQQREWKWLQILGSCNGLLCLQLDYNKRSIWLWNPCTKEFKELPPHQHFIMFPQRRGIIVSGTCGFGYGSTTHDYKVIMNFGYYEEEFLFTLVQLYSLRTDSWKVIGKYPYRIAEHHLGVFVNNGGGGGGGVYWLARRQSIDVIICFDFANEDYKEISTPPSVLIKTVNPESCFKYISSEYVKLTELKGFLCIINPIIEEKCLEVWAMLNEEENEYSSWSKLFTIREPIIALPYQMKSTFQLLGNYKNNNDDEILVLVDGKELLLYNPKNDKTRPLIQMGASDADEFQQVQTCIDSLVSLYSRTYDIF